MLYTFLYDATFSLAIPSHYINFPPFITNS